MKVFLSSSYHKVLQNMFWNLFKRLSKIFQKFFNFICASDQKLNFCYRWMTSSILLACFVSRCRWSMKQLTSIFLQDFGKSLIKFLPKCCKRGFTNQCKKVKRFCIRKKNCVNQFFNRLFQLGNNQIIN